MVDRDFTTQPNGSAHDSDGLRARCVALLDLVFTEDAIFLDSLPDRLEANLVPALGLLAQVLDESNDPAELAKTARLVEQCGVPREECPPELNAMLDRLVR